MFQAVIVLFWLRKHVKHFDISSGILENNFLWSSLTFKPQIRARDDDLAHNASISARCVESDQDSKECESCGMKTMRHFPHTQRKNPRQPPRRVRTVWAQDRIWRLLSAIIRVSTVLKISGCLPLLRILFNLKNAIPPYSWIRHFFFWKKKFND